MVEFVFKLKLLEFKTLLSRSSLQSESFLCALTLIILFFTLKDLSLNKRKHSWRSYYRKDTESDSGFLINLWITKRMISAKYNGTTLIPHIG